MRAWHTFEMSNVHTSYQFASHYGCRGQTNASNRNPFQGIATSSVQNVNVVPSQCPECERGMHFNREMYIPSVDLAHFMVAAANVTMQTCETASLSNESAAEE